MKTMVEQVKEFHETYNVPVLDTPAIPSQDRIDLRWNLIAEEALRELKEAIESKDIVLIADALCDAHYVISGTSLEFGIPEDEVFAEIHRSNMTKLWAHCKFCDVELLSISSHHHVYWEHPISRDLSGSNCSFHSLPAGEGVVMKVHYREDGKVIKPPYYSPANIRGILQKYGLDVKA